MEFEIYNLEDLLERKFEIYDRVKTYRVESKGGFSRGYDRKEFRSNGTIRGYCIRLDGRGWEYFVVLDFDDCNHWVPEIGLELLEEE